MKIVHLYYHVCYKAYMMGEQGEGWSLSPWGKNTPSYEGETLDEGDFLLPDGYELAESIFGKLIYDQWDVECDIITFNGKPMIDGIVLDRAA